MTVKIGVANTEQIPTNPTPGDTITFRCKVYNIGTETSVPCRIALFEGSKLSELKEIPGTSKEVPALQPMKSLSETLDYEFKYQAPIEFPAYRKVWIVLDPERKNQMSHEDWVEKCTHVFQVVVQPSPKGRDLRETKSVIDEEKEIVTIDLQKDTPTTSNDNPPEFSSLPLDITTIIALGGAGLAVLLAILSALF